MLRRAMRRHSQQTLAISLLLLAAAGCTGPAPQPQAPPATTSAHPPNEDPGVTACRQIAEGMTQALAGGPPLTPTEREANLRLLEASGHPELRDAAVAMRGALDADPATQTEAAARLLDACDQVAIEAGLGD
jgi:hypothetical protein